MTKRGEHRRMQVALREQGLKLCVSCGETKALDEFWFTVPAKGYRNRYCKPCTRVEVREAARSNPEPSRRRATARQRRLQAEDPERFRAERRKARATRRARMVNAFVEHVDPIIVFQRDEGVCGICNEPVDRDRYDVDHIIPLAEGGEHSYRNVRVAHVTCNRSRNRIPVRESIERDGAACVCVAPLSLGAPRIHSRTP